MKFLQKADPERLYQTIYQLNYPRHPLTSPEGLERAAEWLEVSMGSVGLRVRCSPFTLESSSECYRNIEGSCGPVDSEPAWVIVAHYDTAAGSPGANDNGSGLAVLLEAARLLAALPDPPPVFFTAVALEESSSPLYAGREAESARRHGLIDERGKFTCWEYARHHARIQKRAMAYHLSGGSQGEGYRIALNELGEQVSVPLRAHFSELERIYADMTPDAAVGRRSRIGSTRWVEDALKRGIGLKGCFVLDEIGIYSDEPGSQRPDARIDFDKYSGGWGLDQKERRANFFLMLSTNDSGDLGEGFEQVCRRPGIELPYARAHLPMDYCQIAANLPKALSSDHAPFWKQGIPALFLFDTSSPRDFWNHTPADTVERVDPRRMALLADSLAAFLAEQAGR